MTYKCGRCNKKFNQKSNYDMHMKRKIPCVEVDNDNNDIKIYKCEYCDIIFGRSDNLKRHIEGRCKEKIKRNEENIIIQEMVEKIEELERVLEQTKALNPDEPEQKEPGIAIDKSKLINHNTQINNNNNNCVKMVPFGKENLEEIVPDSVCRAILLRGMNAVTQLSKYVHFNKDIPECNNVYVSNMRDNLARTYDGNDWFVVDDDDAIDEMRDNKQAFLEAKYKELYETLGPKTITQFERYLKAKNDPVLLKRYAKELKQMMYNNRGMVIETKALVKSQNTVTSGTRKLIKQ
jgi:hypothetical protein